MRTSSRGPADDAFAVKSAPASPAAQRVFAALGDGEFNSGEALAAAAGVTRSALWKSIELLRELGLQIEAAAHRGYRLGRPTAALDADCIVAALDPAARALLRRLEVEWSLHSTNAALLERSPPAPGEYDVLLALIDANGAVIRRDDLLDQVWARHGWAARARSTSTFAGCARNWKTSRSTPS